MGALRSVLLAISVCLATIQTAGAESKPNVVVILADDLGINDLGCYGRQEHETPHLDRLASQGLQFTAAYCAQPICSPSRAAILTGISPARWHLTTYLPGRGDKRSQMLLHPVIRQQLPLEAVTLAERLGDAGYATACIGKWHLGGAGFGPREQGFDEYHPGQADTTPGPEEAGKGEYDLTRAAERFIDEHRDRPFFLHLCHNTPHIRLAARSELERRYAGTFHPTYAAMMATLDDCVGRVLARLDALGLAEKTIVVFTSDNGGLHVLESPESPATYNTPFRAGKGFLYEGGLRVPLIVRYPQTVHAGKTVETPVINTDLTPTLLEWCGAAPIEECDGKSQAKAWAAGDSIPRALFWHFPHYTNQGSRPAGAVRDGRWKLVEQYEDGRLELYDLAADPGEAHDLADVEPARAAEFKRRLAAWLDEQGAQRNERNPAFDQDLHRRLYIDVDVSRLRPGATAQETAEPLREWRRFMNRVD